jgi:hypothetical protein
MIRDAVRARVKQEGALDPKVKDIVRTPAESLVICFTVGYRNCRAIQMFSSCSWCFSVWNCCYVFIDTVLNAEGNHVE